MAVQTIYITNGASVAPGWFGPTQLNGTAPTAANSNVGWTPGKSAITSPYYRGRLGSTTTTGTTQAASWNASTTAPTAGTSNTSTTAGDSFIVGPLSGTFANTAWTFNWNMRATTAGCIGHVNMRMWRGTNAAGTGATQVLANTAGATVTLSTTADTNSSITASPGAMTLNNEYLFFQVEWQETTVGSSNSDDVRFHIGTASITTADYVAAATGTLAVTEISDTVTATGNVPYVGSLTKTEAPDTVTATGRTPYVGTLTKIEAPDTLAASGRPIVGGTLAVTEISDTLAATGTGPAAPIAVAPWPPAFPQHGAGQSLGVTNFDAPGAVQPAISGLVAVAWPPAFPQHRAGQTTGVTNYTHPGAVQPGYQIADTGITGTLAVTETADTLSATGTAPLVVITGTLSVTESPDTVTAAGTVQVRGTLTATQANQTIVATAGPIVAGTLARTQANQTVSAAAASTITGTLAVTEALDTISATGTVTAAADVVLLCHFDNAPFVDVSTYHHTLTATNVTVSTPNPKFGAGCGYWTFGSLNANLDTGNSSDFWFDAAPFTIEAWAYANSNPTGDTYNPILAEWDAVLGNVGFFFNVFPHMMFFCSSDGTAYDYVDTATTPSQNAWHHVAVDRDASGVVRLYLDGAVVGSKTLSVTSIFHSTYHALIGNDASLGRAFPGALDEVRVVRGTAMYGGVAFTPPTAPYLPAEPAAPPATGTLNVVQAPQTITATGGATVSGTLARTQANQTVTATGTLSISGTLSVNQAPQTIAASGGAVVGGTLSRTQANQTIVANGGAIVSGTLVITQAAQTLNATATVSLSGTLARSQAAQTLVAAGTVGVTGALSLSQAPQTLVATGTILTGVIGNLNLTQASQTLASAGTVTGFVGTLNQVQANQTVVASGTVALAGSLNRTQADQTLAASGVIIPVVYGTASLAQAPQTLLATATVVVSGRLSISQDNQTLAATALLGPVTGALALSQANQTLQAIGVLRIVGGLDRTQDDQTLVATGGIGNVWIPGVPGTIPDVPPDRLETPSSSDRLVVATGDDRLHGTAASPSVRTVTTGNGGRLITVPPLRRVA